MGAPLSASAPLPHTNAASGRVLRAVAPLPRRDHPVTEGPEPPPRPPVALADKQAPLSPLDGRRVAAIAVFAFEAVEGARQVDHLGRWITETVAARLSELRALNVERRSLYRDHRRVVPTVRRVRVTQPHAEVLEAAVVLATPSRCRAVALRFETLRGRWQATDITVL